MIYLLHSVEHTLGRELGKVIWGALVVAVAAWHVRRRLRRRK